MKKQEKDKSFQENSGKFLENSNPNSIRRFRVLGCSLFLKSCGFQFYIVNQMEQQPTVVLHLCLSKLK